MLSSAVGGAAIRSRGTDEFRRRLGRSIRVGIG
jgi:hypothetical protein